MLCKNCKTSVPAGEENCPYCGAPARGSKAARRTAAAALAVFSFFCIGYLYLALTGKLELFNSDAEPAAATGESTVNPAAGTSRPLFSQPPQETSSPDLNRQPDDITSLLSAANRAAREYYEGYVDSYMPLVTNRGYLYHFKAKEFITVDFLAEIGLLDKAYGAEPVMILYIRPADFADVKEVSFTRSGELEIFTAYETVNGVALYSPNNFGTVYRESFNEILANYEFLHGEVNRESAGSPDYNGMLDSVSAFAYATEGLDVRYFAADDKYSVAIVSERGDSSVLYGYALEKTNTGWSVALAGLEKYSNLEVYVNSSIPDFNTGLLPSFNVRSPGLAASELLPNFPETLAENGEVGSGEVLDFISGTREYAYLVFNSGKKYIFTYENARGWSYVRVGGWREAEEMLLSINASTCIIRQE